MTLTRACFGRQSSRGTRRLLHSSRYLNSRPQVLLLDKIKLAHSQLEDLETRADIVPFTSSSRAEFLADCSTKYKSVEAIYRHFAGTASIKTTGLFDEELVGQLPQTLKFICHNGAGYDQINIPSCTARQFQVSNVPVAVDAATADTALFLLLSTLRQFKLALSSAQAGTFHSGLPLSNDPAGKVLGILGMGGIGRAFAKRATALGMTVVYHNRTRLGGEVERACGAKYVASMDELLRDSDVVSLNLPLNASTRHLISTDQFKAMKKTAVIINTARGPIIDEKALIAALASNQIAGAGLDVYETEPMIPKELLEDPRVTCLPHVGTLTVETQKEMEAVCLKNISRGLESGKLGFVVGEQKEMWSKLQ